MSRTSAFKPKNSVKRLTLLETIEIDNTVSLYDFDLSSFSGVFDGFLIDLKHINMSVSSGFQLLGSDDGAVSFESFRHAGNVYAYVTLTYTGMTTNGEYVGEVEIKHFEKGVNGCYVRPNEIAYRDATLNVYDEKAINSYMQTTGLALNLLRLLAIAGNFLSGSIKFYGVNYDA